MHLPSRPTVIRHGVTDSTNERAFAALADGSAHHGDLHLASFQTAGRGRLGRSWLAAEGEGLLASLILHPPAPAPPSVALTMATCLGICDAVRALGVTAARLKWPNDILVGDAKLCGILVETRGFDANAPHFVVGFGLNVKQTEFPDEVTSERAVTSLAREGIDIEVEGALDSVWRSMRARLAAIERTDELARDYRDCMQLDSQVQVTSGDREVTGEMKQLTVETGVELRVGEETVSFPLELIHGIGPARRERPPGSSPSGLR